MKALTTPTKQHLAPSTKPTSSRAEREQLVNVIDSQPMPQNLYQIPNKVQQTGLCVTFEQMRWNDGSDLRDGVCVDGGGIELAVG